MRFGINKRAFALIHLDRLQHNAREIQKKLGHTHMMAVIKADAYGHGAIFAAKALTEMGVKWFAVSSIDEAIDLRKHNFTQNILILGYTPPECVHLLCKYDIIPTVFSFSYAKKINNALNGKQRLSVHIKLDTGMNRLGICCTKDPFSALEEIKKIIALPYLKAEGIFSHICHADSFASDAVQFTQGQIDCFLRIISLLEEQKIKIKFKHLQNSACILLHRASDLDLARAGIILYGLDVSQELRDRSLQPVLELKASVSMVKSVAKGDYIGYGRSFRAEQDMTVATVPVGYADGYSRKLSNVGKVLIQGKEVPIVGKICMDQFMADVTGLSIKEGDEAVLIGRQGDKEITAQQVADWIDSISYEVVCMISKRVPRVYMQDGKEIAAQKMV